MCNVRFRPKMDTPAIAIENNNGKQWLKLPGRELVFLK
jgi:hypothetical protein